MTELGEPVAVGMIDTEDWECPFAHDKPGKVDNELDNSSSKLGTRVKNGWSTILWEEKDDAIKPKKKQTLVDPIAQEVDCPNEQGVKVRLDGNTSEQYPFSVSAHHLIPADASLPKSNLKHYIEQGPVIEGDIGYDINGAENGVWLPTHAALSGDMAKGAVLLPGEASAVKYAAVSQEGGPAVASFVQLYAYAVMDETKRQFHDAHGDYSNFVIKVLNKIQANLVNIKNYNCPKCQEAKAGGGKLPPPHTLVRRLNGVSRRLKGHLLGSPSQWKLPLFTSPHAKSYAVDVRLWRKHGI